MVVAVERKSSAVKVNLPLCYITQPRRNTGTIEEQYILVLFAYWPQNASNLKSLLFQTKEVASSVHFTRGWAVHRKIELQDEKNLSYPY
jgi:hypothetical protein